MLHNLLHNKVLHERTIFLTVFNADIPRIPPSERVAVEPLGHQCYQVNVHFGFKDDRDIPQALQLCKQQGLAFEPMETSYFIARQTVIPSVGSGMALWRARSEKLTYEQQSLMRILLAVLCLKKKRY